MEVVKRWDRHGAPRLSAALAFYTLFSLAPLLVVTFALASAVFGERAVRYEIAHRIDGFVGPDAAQFAEGLLRSTVFERASLLPLLLGILTFLLAVSGVFVHLQYCLNTIWNVQPKQRRWVWAQVRKRLLSFVIVAGMVLTVVASLGLQALLAWIEVFLGGRLGLSLELIGYGNIAVTFVLLALFFSLIYGILPDTRTSWRAVIAGGVVTAILLLIGHTSVAFYLQHAGMVSTYGAAGSVVVLLLAVYYMSLIMLLGAEITHSLHSAKHGESAPPQARPAT